MSLAAGITEEDEALEAAERLARELISAEAERIAALGCARHLQHLLRKTAPTEQFESGCLVRRPSKRDKKFQPGDFRGEADKENDHPIQHAKVNSCVEKSILRNCSPTATNLCKFVEVGSPLSAKHSELEPEVHLSTMAHSAGRLRAHGARQQEQILKFQVDLMNAHDLWTERAAETAVLQKRSVDLMDELRQRDAMLSRTIQMETHDASMAVQNACSDLQQCQSELSELKCTAEIVQANRNMEGCAAREEAQQRLEEQIALKCATDAAYSELHSLRNMLQQEEDQVCRLDKLEQNNFAQLCNMGVSKDRCADIYLQEQCGAWTQEVWAQRAKLREQQVERDVAEDARVARYKQEEELTAEKMNHLQSRSEVLTYELSEIRAAVFSQREHVAGEEQLCARLANRLKSKDRVVKRLRHEEHAAEDQRQVLKKFEQQLHALQSMLGKNEQCTKEAAKIETANKSVNPPSAPLEHCDPIGVPLDVCREEAARILASAAPRLGVAFDDHAGDQAGGSNLLCQQDLPHLASAVHGAAQVIRGELVRLLWRLRAVFPFKATASLADVEKMTVRALLSEVREVLRISSLSVHTQPFDMHCNVHVDPESASLSMVSTQEPNSEMLDLTLMDVGLGNTGEASATLTRCTLAAPGHSGVAAEMVPPTTLGASTGHVQVMEKRGSSSCATVLAEPCIVSYPESLAGSPVCPRGKHQTPERFDAVPLAQWDPEEQMCIDQFLGSCGKSVSVPTDRRHTHACESPLQLAPVLPQTESPSAHVRRARGRLRELRLGLAPTMGLGPAECLPRRSASSPMLRH